MNPILPNSETSVYIADLTPEVKEIDLIDLFKSCGKIIEQGIIIKQDQIAINKLKITAIVSFGNQKEAEAAVKLNGSVLNGKTIRVSAYKSPKEYDQEANIFVSKMDPSLSQKDLTEYFSSIGSVLSVKITTDPHSGQSKGYGYVQFVNQADAQQCLEKEVHKVLDQELMVSQFIPLTDREVREKQNLIIKGIPEDISLEAAKAAIDKIFSEVGEIESSVVQQDHYNQESIGYVCYKNSENAEKAISAFNNNAKILNSDRLLTVEFELPKTQRFINHETNIFIKGVKLSTTESQIKKAFEIFGEIINIKLDRPMNKGKPVLKETQFALINFATKEEAFKALKEATKDTKVRDLFEENQIFITPHMTQQNRMILNQMKLSAKNLHVQSPAFIIPPLPMMYPPPAMYYHNQQPPMYIPMPPMMPPMNHGHFSNQNNFNNSNNYTNKNSKSHYNNMSNGNRNDNRNNNYSRNGGNRNYNNGGYQNRNNGGYYAKKQVEQNYTKNPESELEKLKLKIASEEGKKDVKTQFGVQFYKTVKQRAGETLAPKITGMLIDIDVLGLEQVYEISKDENQLVAQIDEAINIVQTNN